jgi:sporulation protein YlmC with PRC-barrel domain
MMFNIVRRSQIVGLMAIERSTATRYGRVEEVWVDRDRRVKYFASDAGYTPFEQIAIVGPDALLTYSKLAIAPPPSLHHLHRMAIRTPSAIAPLGWVEDFLFDWETGNIAAYILGGEIAAPFGGSAILFPDYVESIAAEAIAIGEDAPNSLKSESEGLQGFLSEKSHQVKNLVKHMGDRLHDLVSPHDKPEVVRVKIKAVRDELAQSSQHEKNALQEASEFLQDKWEDLQHSLSNAGERMKQASDSAWKRLTHSA